jgi:hypothetical protein
MAGQELRRFGEQMGESAMLDCAVLVGAFKRIGYGRRSFLFAGAMVGKRRKKGKGWAQMNSRSRCMDLVEFVLAFPAQQSAPPRLVGGKLPRRFIESGLTYFDHKISVLGKLDAVMDDYSGEKRSESDGTPELIISIISKALECFSTRM